MLGSTPGHSRYHKPVVLAWAGRWRCAGMVGLALTGHSWEPGDLWVSGATRGGHLSWNPSDAHTVMVVSAVGLPGAGCNLRRNIRSSAKTRKVEIHYSGCNDQGGAILERAAGPRVTGSTRIMIGHLNLGRPNPAKVPIGDRRINPGLRNQVLKTIR